MSFAAIENIVQALLYEGYLLYPYRPSALKNRQRWLFGRLLPREYSLEHGEAEPWKLQTECLIVGSSRTELEVSVRFLQLAESGDGRNNPTSRDTTERDVPVKVNLEQIENRPARITFAFPPHLDGAITLLAMETCPGLFKLTAIIENVSPGVAGKGIDVDGVLGRSLLSTNTMLSLEDGAFISLIDPPEPYRAAAASCRNIGTWPVLVGQQLGKMMLAAPIVLYDYPQLAAESPGDLFDGTEIDELLSLRIQTLTEVEKHEMSAAGERARRLLERTESLTEDQFGRLHGRLRGRTVREQECGFQSGDRVRLRPRPGADALDLLLIGQIATVVSVQRDFEDGIHLGVVVDDDPGRDYGEQGLPGHRFFYRPEEVELL